MDLSNKISQISGIGPNMARRLERLELSTVSDLINHYPFRYDDFSEVNTAQEANIGQKITVTGEIWSIKNTYTRFGKVITRALLNDGVAPIELTWFNQFWLTKQIKTGDILQVSGKLAKYKNKLSIVAPQWKKLPPTNHIGSVTLDETQSSQPNQLIPIYPETEGLTSKWLDGKISQVLPEVLNQIEDPLPENIRDGMMELSVALKKIHQPKSWDDVQKARDRLGFDELFFVQLATQRARAKWKQKPTVTPLNKYPKKLSQFTNKLPFKLTGAQRRVITEIIEDLSKTYPMNRLVQGEVGSGKTVVGAIAAYLVYLNGYSTLLMAPTEILAFQHFETMKRLLEPFGITVGIYTGSRKFDKNQELRIKNYGKNHNSRFKTQDSKPHIIVGTHALLLDKLNMNNVGLVIIDEQQRFGVEQRTILRNKAKLPHFLTTTATPIPRTIALTLYGDLDLSVIDELPVGRKKIKTYVVPERKRQDAYGFITKQVKSGDQVYIITPLIEQSETMASAKAATVEYKRLQKEVFPDLKLGLLHGRLKSKEKEEVINAFKNQQLDILVSTSVVEVGMDIQNATIMVIESADRFGLAQLHQLRGRVGRGEKQSYCLLFSENNNEFAYKRLKNLETIDEGLKLAELDLKIRGSGEIFGTRQSGRFEFKIASLTDLGLVEKTKAAAQKILAEDPSLDKHPKLEAKLREFSSEVLPD